MPTAVPPVNPSEARARPLADHSMEELVARRCELAEQIDPLLLRLEAIDDVIMHRRRAQRRAQILAGPAEVAGESCDAPGATEVVG